jgi:hypothetical protein
VIVLHRKIRMKRPAGRAAAAVVAASLLLGPVAAQAQLQAVPPQSAPTQPVTPQPVTPRPVTPQPVAPQLVTPQSEPRSAPGMLQTPLPDMAAAQEYAESFLTDIWDAFRHVLWTATGYLSPPTVTDVARYHGGGEDPYDFIQMMDTAGYKLKEVHTAVALIPSVSFTFAVARELSDADREWLAGQLVRHARTRSGLVAAAERSIVQSLLDAQELGGYEIETVEVDLFPWPTVKFAISPVDAPLGSEAAKLLRAIEKVGESVKAVHTQQAPVPKVEVVPVPADAPVAPEAAPRTPVQARPPG